MKFAYITNNRLPSEKSKCFPNRPDVFSAGELWRRRDSFLPCAAQSQKFEGVDLFDYYKLPRNFKLLPLPCLDLFPLSGGNAVVEQPIFFLQTLTFALSLVWILRNQSLDVYYARDFFVLGAILAAFRQLKKRMFFEAHTFPESKFGREWQRRVIKRLGGWSASAAH